MRAFDLNAGLVLVDAEVVGPTNSGTVQLALDTGAITTSLNTEILEILGCDLGKPLFYTELTTASGVQQVPIVLLHQITALGIECYNLPVVANTLPPGSKIGGLLGLDFMRGRKLTIDFADGTIEIK